MPSFQDLMLPLLIHSADGVVHSWRRLRDECAEDFGLTDGQLGDRIPSGGTRFDSRINFALAHLVQAGLLARPKRGYLQITPRGREVIDRNLHRVDIDLLREFEEYREFQAKLQARTPPPPPRW